jgi:hypothetical protein
MVHSGVGSPAPSHRRTEGERKAGAECLHRRLLARPAGEERSLLGSPRQARQIRNFAGMEMRARNRHRVAEWADGLDVHADGDPVGNADQGVPAGMREVEMKRVLVRDVEFGLPVRSDPETNGLG